MTKRIVLIILLALFFSVTVQTEARNDDKTKRVVKTKGNVIFEPNQKSGKKFPTPTPGKPAGIAPLLGKSAYDQGGCDPSGVPPQTGTEDSAKKEVSFSNALGNYTADIYYPATKNGSSYTLNTAGAPFPVMMFTPGSWADKDMYTWIGTSYAKSGYIVAIFSPPSEYEEDVNKEFNERLEGLRTLQTLLTSPESLDLGFLAGKIDTNMLIQSGHSLGANVAIYEAAKNPSVKAVIALAPATDVAPFAVVPAQGAFSYAAVTAPVQILIGSNDDQHEEAWDIYNNLPGTKEILIVKGANHVGFMDDSFLIDLAPYMGEDNPADITTEETHSIAGPYILAWQNYFVRGDVMNREIIFGNRPVQDKASGLLSDYQYQE